MVSAASDYPGLLEPREEEGPVGGNIEQERPKIATAGRETLPEFLQRAVVRLGD